MLIEPIARLANILIGKIGKSINLSQKDDHFVVIFMNIKFPDRIVFEESLAGIQILQ